MSVTRTKNGTFKSSLLPDAEFDNAITARHFDSQEAQRLRNDEVSKAEELLAEFTPEQVAAIGSLFARESDKKLNQAQTDANIAEFLESHSEMKPGSRNTFLNGTQLNGWLVAHGKTRPYAIEDMEEGYQELLAAGELLIDHPEKMKPRNESQTDEGQKVLDRYESILGPTPVGFHR